MGGERWLRPGWVREMLAGGWRSTRRPACRRGMGVTGQGSGGEASMTISVGQLTGRLIAAVPVPFGPAGSVHSAGLERYSAWMHCQPIGGVAVWAHTGRGLRLSDAVADRVLVTWRKALPAGC